MHVKQSNFSVADFLNQLDREEIIVNRDYQRSPGVWPASVQSYFVETILLGYPIPKLALFTKTDVKSRTTVKELVDGQQRVTALRSFVNNDIRVPRKSTLPCAGKSYDQLEKEEKLAFLAYTLPVDLFVETTEAEIREMFRRINSYTAPLNAEEQRHARFQGAFKWFIHREGGTYATQLVELGVFNDRQVNRMADAKLLSEVVHAMVHGIKTTNKKLLDKLYKDFDEEFEQDTDIHDRLAFGFSTFFEFESIHDTPLTKHYNLYSFLLAATHVHAPIDSLQDAFRMESGVSIDFDVARRGLGNLAGALEDPESFLVFEAFVAACEGGTNVADKRKTRFVWICKALLGQ